MFKFTTKKLAVCGVICALYTVLSLLTFPVASGSIQIRLSEGLTILPLILPESVIAITAGCLLSNLITGCAIFDIVFGTLITFVAGVLTCVIGIFIRKTALKIFVGGLFPVILNAFLLPIIWYFCYGELEYLYILQVGVLLISQSISVYVIGTACYLTVAKLKSKNNL